MTWDDACKTQSKCPHNCCLLLLFFFRGNGFIHIFHHVFSSSDGVTSQSWHERWGIRFSLGARGWSLREFIIKSGCRQRSYLQGSCELGWPNCLIPQKGTLNSQRGTVLPKATYQAVAERGPAPGLLICQPQAPPPWFLWPVFVHEWISEWEWRSSMNTDSGACLPGLHIQLFHWWSVCFEHIPWPLWSITWPHLRYGVIERCKWGKVWKGL